MLCHERLGYDREWRLLPSCTTCMRSLYAELFQIIALSSGVGMRLLGISIASFSTGSFGHTFTRQYLKTATPLA